MESLPKPGQGSTCKNCRVPIRYDTYRNTGSYEPDYDPGNDRLEWRHVGPQAIASGYTSCDFGAGVRAEPIEEYVYVASSWRNSIQPLVVAELRKLNIPHYDFKHPTGLASDGFHWSDVMPNYHRVGPGQPEQLAPVDDYLQALLTEEADAGFNRDWDAMNRAETFVLVLPCNRSAHLELGWAVGAGRRTAVLLDGPLVTPELMYKMVDRITPDLDELIRWIQNE